MALPGSDLKMLGNRQVAGGGVASVAGAAAIAIAGTATNPTIAVKVDGVTVVVNGSDQIEATGTGLVPTSRSVNTTAPLSGGGNLSADRTIALDLGGTAPGVFVSANELYADLFAQATDDDRPTSRMQSTETRLLGCGATGAYLALVQPGTTLDRFAAVNVIDANTIANGAIAAGRMYGMPFQLNDWYNLNAIGFRLRTPTGAGNSGFLAIYRATSRDDWRPDARVAVSGLIDFNTSGDIEATIDYDCPPDFLHYAVLYSETVTDVTLVGGAQSQPVFGKGAFTGVTGSGWTVARAFDDTCPATFPGGGAVLDFSGLTLPAIFLRGDRL